MAQRNYWISALFCAAASLLTQASAAQVAPYPSAPVADSGFRQYLDQVRIRAAQQGVSQATLNRVIPSLNYNERVVSLDRAQPEGAADAPIPQFAPYKAKHVDAQRMSRGRSSPTRARGTPQLRRPGTQRSTRVRARSCRGPR